MRDAGIESNGTTGIYFAAHDNPKEIITVVRTGVNLKQVSDLETTYLIATQVDQWGLGLIFSSVQNPSIGQSTKDGKGPGIAFEVMRSARLIPTLTPTNRSLK